MNQKLLKKLQENLEKISVNELKNVRPEALFLKIGTDKFEFMEFIEDLHKERLVTYKYNTTCGYCGCGHTIYESEINNVKKICDACGTPIILREATKRGRVIYTLDKNEILQFGIDEIDFTTESIKQQDSNLNTNTGILINLSERKKNMKIFISHSESDKALVRFLINLLEGMGVPKDKEHIFCSSYNGFGVECGEDILDYIKDEFTKEEIIVLYVITENFLDSKACLCEMGGAWVLSKMFIPLVMPPASFDAIQGTLLRPSIKGIKLDDYIKLDELMDKITKEFKINKDLEKWSIAKNEFIENIKLIKQD